MAGGLMVTAGAASGAAATQRPVAHPAHQPPAQFLARARTALQKYLQHNHPTIMLTDPGARPKAAPGSTTGMGSFNWSGYADTSTAKLPAFSRVRGHWVMPAVTCTREDTITAQWVGLDGLTSQTVEQDGTIGWCFEGVPTYFTWYEMFPADTVVVGTSLRLVTRSAPRWPGLPDPLLAAADRPDAPVEQLLGDPGVRSQMPEQQRRMDLRAARVRNRHRAAGQLRHLAPDQRTGNVRGHNCQYRQ